MATIRLDVTKITGIIEQEVMLIAEEVAKIGEQAARQQLNSAVTRYGLFRMSRGRGRSAGRNDTGSMIDNLLASKPITDKAGHVIARFGWGRGRSKAYYKFQDNGTSRIKAANALLTGQKAVMNEMPRLTKNLKQRIRRRLGGK